MTKPQQPMKDFPEHFGGMNLQNRECPTKTRWANSICSYSRKDREEKAQGAAKDKEIDSTIFRGFRTVSKDRICLSFPIFA